MTASDVRVIWLVAGGVLALLAWRGVRLRSWQTDSLERLANQPIRFEDPVIDVAAPVLRL